jgi:uncharacterized OsmC-like protein
MSAVEVEYTDGERYEVAVRGHRLVVDQPLPDGGADSAATPTELFVVSLATSVAYYAGRYLARLGLPRDGLRIHAGFEMASRPARVGSVRLRVTVPPGFPPERLAGLHAVASHCTVHNTLRQPPSVDIDISDHVGDPRLAG